MKVALTRRVFCGFVAASPLVLAGCGKKEEMPAPAPSAGGSYEMARTFRAPTPRITVDPATGGGGAGGGGGGGGGGGH